MFGGAAHPAAVTAARAAAERRLCIVTGGPGTGKTTLAAGLIALLADLGIARAHRIGLVTPTGKAAARLQEAVTTQLDQGGLRSRVPALRQLQTLGRHQSTGCLPGPICAWMRCWWMSARWWTCR